MKRTGPQTPNRAFPNTSRVPSARPQPTAQPQTPPDPQRNGHGAPDAITQDAPVYPAQHNQNANGPVSRVVLFPISGSIWMRYLPDGRPVYSVSFQRTYKDAQGKWQYASSFNGTDLLALSEAAKLAYYEINRLRAGDRETERSAESEEVPF